MKLIVFLLIAIFMFSVFAGCSANYSPQEEQKEGSGYFDRDDNEQNNSNERDDSNENNFDPERKIIYTSSLKIETIEYENSISALENLIKEYNGFIQDSRVENQTQSGRSFSLRRATYTLRIPSDNRLDFLTASGDVGTIILNQTKGEDVTERFFDSQARLDAFKTQEERLLELLSEAANLSEILNIEDRLTKVRYEIESLSGTISKLSALISLSTVNVEIIEVRELTEPKAETFGEEIVKTFKSSISALTTTLRYATLVLVAILPFTAVLFIFIVVLIVIIKSCRKKRAKKIKTE